MGILDKEINSRKNTLLPRWAYVLLTLLSIITLLFFTLMLVMGNIKISSESYFFVLIIYGVSTAILIFTITEVIADLQGKMMGFNIKAGGPLASILIIILFGMFFKPKASKEQDINIQLHSNGDLSNIPIKSKPNCLVLIPTFNSGALVADVNSKGIATFNLSEKYYENNNNVRFQLLSQKFKLKEPNKEYKLTNQRELKIEIEPQKAQFRFTFLNKKSGKPLSNVRMISSELKIDTISNELGIIQCLIDTINILSYTFYFEHQNYIYNGHNELYIDQTTPKFLFEKK